MRFGIGNSEIREHSIFIAEYPFEPSIAYPEKLIKASEIDNICIEFGIVKIKVARDIVFVSAEKKDQVKNFATTNNIKLVAHSWHWDWILEPFLDTEYTKENDKLIRARLADSGFNKGEVDKIRKEVADQMYKYNADSMLWDWCSLGLSDVLSAMSSKYSKEAFRIFYKRR